ncbi:unnamed protein product [Closterium sp. NIES-54]
MVTTTTPGGQRVSICTCTRTGRHLATFTHRPGSSLYILATEPPQVDASAQLSASGPVSASPPTLAGPPCLPCVEGRQHAAPHSSFLPTSAPLQTHHMNVWGPARVSGQDRKRFILLVVDDYTRYTTIFPLRSKGEVPGVLILWIRAVPLQLRERFGQDLPVLRLHSDRGGEFSSNLLRDFCRGEGILQSFTLPASPQQNGIAERRIGLVMEVACTSMIHAASPHFLWPLAVGDASVFRVWGSRAFVRDMSADKLSACAIPCVFLGFPPDTPGWQFYHPTSRRVIPSQDVTFDESVPFYRLFPYRSAPLPPPPLFLAPCPPQVDPLPPQGPAPSGVSQVDPLPCTVPVEVAVDSCAARGAASGGAELARAEPGGAEPAGAEPGGAESEGAGSGVADSWGAEPGGTDPVGANLGGAGSAGAEPGGAEPEHAEPGGTELGAAELGGAEPERAELGGAEPERTEPGGTLSTGGPPGALSWRESLSPPQLREWFAWHTLLWSGAAGAGGAVGVGARGTGVGAPGGTGAAGHGGACTGGTGAAGAGGAAGVGDGGTGAGAAGGTGAAGPGGARPGGTGAAGAGGAAGVGAGHLGAGDAGAGGAGPGGAGAVGAGSRDTGQLRPYFPASPLPSPPYTNQTRGLTERRDFVSRPVSPVHAVHTGHCVPRPRPPSVPSTHHMALRPSSIPLRIRLPSPPASSLADGPDPESDLSAAASALAAELVDFAAACRLDYAASHVAESESDCPPSVRGECALGMDVLEDRQEEFECFAAALPHLVSMLIAPEGDPNAPDIPTPCSYAEAITGPYSSQW